MFPQLQNENVLCSSLFPDTCFVSALGCFLSITNKQNDCEACLVQGQL